MTPPVSTHPHDDRLLELAYGEVPASEARRLRQHVDGCPRCRSVLDGIAEVRSALRSVPAERPPIRGLDSLLAYGEQAAARARSRRGGLRILGILSAAAALAVVWLVLPAPQKQAKSVAQVPAAPASDTLARADVPRAPAQGSSARDEADRERAMKAPASPPAAAVVGKGGRAVLEESRASAPRVGEPEAKQKELAKLDAPADRRPSALPPEQVRADDIAADRSVARLNVSGQLGGASISAPRTAGGAGASSVAGAGTVAGAEAFAAKKSATVGQAPAAEARSAEAMRTEDPAKVAAAPLNEALAKSERGRASADAEPASPAGSLHQAASAPSGTKDGAPAPVALAPKVVPVQPMRVGMGSPEKRARLAEIRRQLETTKGDERKALLLERCEIDASLQRGPDAVLHCSIVGREFPGTPEAKRAAEIARGFSVQLPAEVPER